MYTVRFWQQVDQDEKVTAQQSFPEKHLYTDESIAKDSIFYDTGSECVWFEMELKVCPQIGWSINPELEGWDSEKLPSLEYSMVKNIHFCCKSNFLMAEMECWTTNYSEDFSRLYGKLNRVLR